MLLSRWSVDGGNGCPGWDQRKLVRTNGSCSAHWSAANGSCDELSGDGDDWTVAVLLGRGVVGLRLATLVPIGCLSVMCVCCICGHYCGECVLSLVPCDSGYWTVYTAVCEV